MLNAQALLRISKVLPCSDAIEKYVNDAVVGIFLHIAEIQVRFDLDSI